MGEAQGWRIIHRRDLVRVRLVTPARVRSCRAQVTKDHRRGRSPQPVTSTVAAIHLDTDIPDRQGSVTP